jgi:hypothetical protein
MNEWEWAIGAVMLTGEKQIKGQKNIRVSFCSPQIVHILAGD